MMSAVPQTSPHASLQPVRTLADLGVGERARILRLSEPSNVGERLLEMGLCPGTEVRLLRRGLLGDPLLVWVRGYALSLRRAQARAVRIARRD